MLLEERKTRDCISFFGFLLLTAISAPRSFAALTFNAPIELSTGVALPAGPLLVGDFNGDGIPDVVTAVRMPRAAIM